MYCYPKSDMHRAPTFSSSSTFPISFASGFMPIRILRYSGLFLLLYQELSSISRHAFPLYRSHTFFPPLNSRGESRMPKPLIGNHHHENAVRIFRGNIQFTGGRLLLHPFSWHIPVSINHLHPSRSKVISVPEIRHDPYSFAPPSFSFNLFAIFIYRIIIRSHPASCHHILGNAGH